MKFFYALGIFFILSIMPLLAEEVLKNKVNLPSAERRLELARSAQDYPVTPGDIYQLVYSSAYGSHSLEILIRSDYQANISIFGNLSTQGLTALQFCKTIEEMVRKAYPDSRPNCFLKRCGVFTVTLIGEVMRSGSFEAWGLTTLEEILAGRLTQFSSIRKIEIERSGQKQSFDLFKALRTGTRAGNPYLKASDLIRVEQASLQIEIQGEVFKPGVYELLPGETLQEALSQYAKGLRPTADLKRVYFWRSPMSKETEGKAFILDLNQKENLSIPLRHLDYIRIPAINEQLPVVYFEGALEVKKTEEGQQPTIYSIYALRYYEGLKLSAALREIAQFIKCDADLKNALLFKAGSSKPELIDLEALLYGYRQDQDVILNEFDRIHIPAFEYWVTVSGAVINPGRYPWSANKTYQYYLQLAGGCDPLKNTNNSVSIFDAQNTKKENSAIIQPNDRILAEYNNALYHFQQWVPILTLTVSAAALVIGLIQIFY